MKGPPIPHRATPGIRCILAHAADIFISEAVGQALSRLYFQYGFLLVFLSWAVSQKGVYWQEPHNTTGRCFFPSSSWLRCSHGCGPAGTSPRRAARTLLTCPGQTLDFFSASLFNNNKQIG